jgi:hypothetical protein
MRRRRYPSGNQADDSSSDDGPYDLHIYVPNARLPDEASQQITGCGCDEYRGNGLILDHVAEASNLLLRLAGGLIIQAFRLRPRVTG